MRTDVVCVGAGGMDITTSLVDEKRVFRDMVNYVDSITACPGGDALNEALTLGKLGHSVGFLGCIGEDVMGHALRSAAEACGVNMSSVKVSRTLPTQTVISLVAEGDNRTFFFRKENASQRLDISCIDWDAVENAKVLSFGSLLFCESFDGGQLLELFRRAKAHGVITCADIALSDEVKDLAVGLEKVFPYIDYIFPNYEEAAALSGREDPEAISDYFLGLGVKNAIIKLGGDGCFAKGSEGVHRVPIFRVETVNTTGAGDNFLAGFISGLLQGLNMRERLVFGSATAALTVQVEGASDGVKSMEQVCAFLSGKRDEKREGPSA